MSSSTAHLPLGHTTHHNTFSPARSERTRTPMGEFASPTPYTNGHASGSNGLDRSGSHGINLDTPNGDIHTAYSVNGDGLPKPEKKRKKKGWKGWALVIEDDLGNVLEINDGPAPDPLPSSRRARTGRDSTTATVPPVPDIPVVKKSKSPTPHFDGHRARGSTPPSFPIIPSSPKKNGGYWKPRKTPLPEPLPIPAASQPPPKRTRQNSIAASTLSPDPIEQTSQVPKTADAPRPRHSLPKAKPITKKPRASMSNGQTRSQPTRGDNQAAATPIITPDSRPAKTPREDLPAKTLRTKPMEQSPSQTIAVREEASHILARANEHRELTRLPPALSSPDDDETTPASSMRFFRPASLSRTGYVEARIKLSVDDEAESEDFDAAFEAEFEKVKDAYRQGIQPWNNPYAPQEHSVPVYGLEDAEPPEWTEDQSPSIVLSTHRDRIYPEDIVGLAHRLGYDGLTEALAKDAHGFVENVKDNLTRILTHYLPLPDAHRDAFLEHLGRDLTKFGQSLTDSGSGALSDHTLPRLPPPGPTFD